MDYLIEARKFIQQAERPPVRTLALPPDPEPGPDSQLTRMPTARAQRDAGGGSNADRGL